MNTDKRKGNPENHIIKKKKKKEEISTGRHDNKLCYKVQLGPPLG